MTGKKVLITGCSDGGLGSALALEMHNQGYNVIATARNASKLSDMHKAGIKTMTLDVLSADSISKCVSQVSDLDILVNNAGSIYMTALSDASIEQAKQMYDLNVWSVLAVTQKFLPLILQSKGTIINHTSSAADLQIPFNSIYASSKAAASKMTGALRAELSPFGVKVVELKTVSVHSNIFSNAHPGKIPANSLYQPAREWLSRLFRSEGIADGSISAQQWAKDVVPQLKNPPKTIWEGGNKRQVYWSLTLLPSSLVDKTVADLIKLPLIQKMIRDHGVSKTISEATGARAVIP